MSRWDDEFRLVGENDDLYAIAKVELPEDVGDAGKLVLQGRAIAEEAISSTDGRSALPPVGAESSEGINALDAVSGLVAQVPAAVAEGVETVLATGARSWGATAHA